MKKLKVTLEITLDEDEVNEFEEGGLTEEETISRVKKHIEMAVGNSTHDYWYLIEDVEVTEIEAVE